MSFKKFLMKQKIAFFSFLVFFNYSILDAFDGTAPYNTNATHGNSFENQCQKLISALTTLKTKCEQANYSIETAELENIKRCMESMRVGFKEKFCIAQLDILEAHIRIIEIIKRRSDRMKRYTALLAKSDSISPAEMESYTKRPYRTENLEEKTARITKRFHVALNALCDYSYYCEILPTQSIDSEVLKKFKKSWAYGKRNLDEEQKKLLEQSMATLTENSLNNTDSRSKLPTTETPAHQQSSQIKEPEKNNTSSIQIPKFLKENLLTFPLSFYVAGLSLGFQITHNAPATLSKHCIDLFLAQKITDTAAFNRAIDFALLQHNNAKNIGYLALGSIALFATQRILSAESIIEKKESFKEYFKKEHLFMWAAGVALGAGAGCFINSYVKNQFLQA